MIERIVESPPVQSSRAVVTERLRRFRVPLEQWGKGAARGLEQLLAEIQAGETTLEETADGKLARVVRGAHVNVYVRNASGTWKLVEERQVFADGRTRRRPADADASVREKMKPGESPEAAARRGLFEDLGIADGELRLSPADGVHEAIAPSKTFPGLQTKFISQGFSLTLPNEYYRPEGYVKKQPDKTTYFVWARV